MRVRDSLVRFVAVFCHTNFAIADSVAIGTDFCHPPYTVCRCLSCMHTNSRLRSSHQNCRLRRCRLPRLLLRAATDLFPHSSPEAARARLCHNAPPIHKQFICAAHRPTVFNATPLSLIWISRLRRAARRLLTARGRRRRRRPNE